MKLLTSLLFLVTTVTTVKAQGNGKGQTDNSQTHRYTICHRTCSKTNPWVRSTIDEDALDAHISLDGTANHTVLQCNEDDYSAWGSHTKDYILKTHGTRDDVETTLGKKGAQEYWQNWDSACPYANRGKCCSFELGECCGDPPSEEGTDPPSPGPTTGADDPQTPSPTPGDPDDPQTPSPTPAPPPGCTYTLDPLADGATCSTDGDTILQYVENTHNVGTTADIIHTVSFDTVSNTVSFKVANPFGEDRHDLYVLYDAPSTTGSGDVECSLLQRQTSCPDQTVFEAKCLNDGSNFEYTVVTVYAVGSGAADALIVGSEEATINECCPAPQSSTGSENNPNSGVAAYTFVINCCPTATQRFLRRHG